MDKAKEFVGKYWVGLLCGVIALIAIIASFVPLGTYHEELKGKLDKSAKTYTELNTLMTAHRLKPKKLDDPEQAELPMFPSQSVIDSGKDLVKTLEDQSKRAMSTVVKANFHEPLVRGVFPNPTINMGYNFRDAYNKRILWPDGTLITGVLHATMPPTKEQIDAEAKRRWSADFAPRLIPDATGAAAINKEQIEREYQDAMALLPGQMRKAAAGAAKVYMAPTVLQIDKAVSEKTAPPPTPTSMWWAQMALWVQEDVAAAVAEANKEALDVTQSRVKRILTVNFPIGPQMVFGKTLTVPGGSMVGGAEAAVPPQSPTDEVKLEFRGTPSGRVSCGLFDVVQYQVELVITAKELPAVLASFSDNKLVTVLNVENLGAEDGAAASRDGFLYGQDPVIKVMLRCESLFLREWTTPMMPDVIKKMLGVPPPPAPVQ